MDEGFGIQYWAGSFRQPYAHLLCTMKFRILIPEILKSCTGSKWPESRFSFSIAGSEREFAEGSKEIAESLIHGEFQEYG
jgi:hypothetical protein